MTGKKSLITLDRTGHTEQKLIVALANPDLSREKKDHALSMYLWERGAENSSLLVDLMRYKGEHTKESRVFQSRMRFDFESFVAIFISHLVGQAERLGKTLGIDIREEKSAFENWLHLPNNTEKEYTYLNYYQSNASEIDLDRVALIEMAMYDLDQADSLRKSVDRITQARMARQGGGIYVDRNGRPFNANDPDIEEIVKKDRELQQEAEQD